MPEKIRRESVFLVLKSFKNESPLGSNLQDHEAIGRVKPSNHLHILLQAHSIPATASPVPLASVLSISKHVRKHNTSSMTVMGSLQNEASMGRSGGGA